MSDIFISYSRKDIAYARLLHKALKENDFETWVDWQDIPPSTEWLKEIFTAIEEANTFIFILSASSVLSDICVKEIEHAGENNKRIIPIVIDDVSPSKVHPALAAINWIFSRTEDELKPAIDSLIEAIQTDYDWVKAHTRLQMRALEWERANQDKSFLLQGTDLHHAEDWLGRASGKEPEPTLLQSRYIQASRQSAVKSQRRLLISVAGALVVTIALGIVAVINGQRAEQNALALSTQVAIAEEQALLAHIRELTVVSQQEGLRFDVAMLLGLESYNTVENVQTMGNLLRLDQKHPEVLRIMVNDSADQKITFSPDGKYLASIGSNTGLILWDTITGQPTGEFPKIRFHQISIAPDGRTIALFEDNQVFLYDLTSGMVTGESAIKMFSEDGIAGYSFSPDGKLLAVGGMDRQVYLFEVPSLQPIGEPMQGFYSEGGDHVIFSPNGKTLAYTSGENNIATRIKLWDVVNGQPLGELIPRLAYNHIHTLAFSPDGSVLASAGESPVINLWDVSSWQQIKEIDHGQNAVLSISFSPDGNTLASASRDRTIKFLDVVSGQAVGDPLLVHNGEVTDIEYSPDGSILASCSLDGTIILWDTITETVAPDKLRLQEAWNTNDITFSPDGEMLAIGYGDGTTRLWRVEDQRPIGGPMVGHSGGVTDLAFRLDGQILATAGIDGKIILWDTTTLQPLYAPLSTGIPSAQEMVVAFHPDGNLLASANYLGNSQSFYDIFLWDLTADELIGESLETDIRYIVSLAFSPDGSLLAVGGEAGTTLLDLNTNTPVGHLEQLGWVSSLAFSPDSALLVSGSDASTMMLWDVAMLQPVGDLPQVHTVPITNVNFSPDGTFMASASMDGAIYLWDVASRNVLGDALATSADGHGTAIFAFSSDGGSLMVLREDGTRVSWDLNVSSWHTHLCARAGRNFTNEEWDFYFPDEPYHKTCEQWPEGK